MNHYQFKQAIYPIAKLGDNYLLILKSELSKVGKGLGVLAIKIEMMGLEIFKPEDLERHLKFNPWEEILSENEREIILNRIENILSEDLIQKKILNPLNGGKEQVYISSLLRKEQGFYGYFTNLLKEYQMEPVELHITKDIWCRDFMPVKSCNGSFLLFNYDPWYLNDKKYSEKKTIRESIIAMLNQHEIRFEDINDIKLDGGNVVSCIDRVIITDIIFKENGIDKHDRSGQTHLVSRLEDHFQAAIVIIPHQPGDILGHSDGIVRLLNSETVLVNNYSSVPVPGLIESKTFLDSLFGALGNVGLNIIQVPYSPVKGTGKDRMPLAYGFYINFLETSDYIFLPQFKEEFKEKDDEAVKQFSDIFKSIGKRVIPVDSRSIAYGGGVLNCITWN